MLFRTVLNGSLLIYILTVAWQSAFCQQDTKSPPGAFFTSDEMVSTRISADFQLLVKNKDGEEPIPATMEFLFPDGEEFKTDLTIRLRGFTRREICKFPPLLLNFPKKNMTGPVDGLNKVKLVTHCRGANKYDDYVLKEYLAYRIYNELTSYSLKVRLLEIEYENTGKAGEIEKEYGFLIEDIDDMAKRLGYKEFNAESFGLHRQNPEKMALMDLFQYMIGNLDWSASKMHNCKLIVADLPNGQQDAIAIPYDFDYSGFVATEYAVPPKEFGLRSVQERLYRGLCRDADYFDTLIPHFVEKREVIMKLVNESKLSDGAKKKLISFIDDFYEIIENPKKIERTIMAECR